MIILPPEEVSLEDLSSSLEQVRNEHRSLLLEIAQVRFVLDKAKEELTLLIDKSTKMEKLLLSSISSLDEAKQHKKTYQVQKKQLEDHSEFLGKQQKRIQDWEKEVQKQESKNYTMQADTGYLGATFNGSL